MENGEIKGSWTIDTLSVAVMTLVVILAIWVATPVTDHNGGEDSDGRYYAAMARLPFSTDAMVRTPPFSWRLIAPLMASWLPFELVTNFRVLALVSHWVASVLLYVLLLELGLSSGISKIGVLLYLGVFWTAKFSFYSPFYVDWAMMPVELGIFVSLVARRHRLVPWIIGIGVLVREQIALLGIVAWLHVGNAEQWNSRQALWVLAKILVPSLIAAVAVRLLLPSEVPDNTLAEAWDLLGSQLLNVSYWPRFLLAAFSGLGLLPLVLLILIRPICRWAKSNLSWLAAAAVAILVLLGGYDKSRLFLFGLPVFIVLTCAGLERLLSVTGLYVKTWLAVTLIIHYYLGHQFQPIVSFEEYVYRMVPEHTSGSLNLLLFHDGAIAITWVVFSMMMLHPWRMVVGREGQSTSG